MNGDTPKSIVHPTDLSFASQDAFAHALRIAVACKSMLHILHIEAPETEEDDWSRFPQVREMLARWKMIAPTATREDVAEQLGVKFVKASVESESPVVGVAAYVERHLCDLLVMMTRPRSALERLLASSVAEETARETHVPALFLREDQKGLRRPGDGRRLAQYGADAGRGDGLAARRLPPRRRARALSQPGRRRHAAACRRRSAAF